MLPSCLYLYALLNLPECQADARTTGHASRSIWATDVPGWITAAGTAILAIFAIVTAIYAIRAFRKQSREVAILAEQNDRDIAEREQAQAARVYTGVEDTRPLWAHPYAKNGSDFPGLRRPALAGRPGRPVGPRRPPHDPARGLARDRRDISYLDALDNTVLTFRDAAGARWIRMPDGTIRKQERDAPRDSILAALGRPLPAPSEPAAAAGPPGSDEPGAGRSR
jgi:hypothetical protein